MKEFRGHVFEHCDPRASATIYWVIACSLKGLFDLREMIRIGAKDIFISFAIGHGVRSVIDIAVCPWLALAKGFCRLRLFR
jgi:hypothetical protein